MDDIPEKYLPGPQRPSIVEKLKKDPDYRPNKAPLFGHHTGITVHTDPAGPENSIIVHAYEQQVPMYHGMLAADGAIHMTAEYPELAERLGAGRQAGKKRWKERDGFNRTHNLRNAKIVKREELPKEVTPNWLDPILWGNGSPRRRKVTMKIIHRRRPKK